MEKANGILLKEVKYICQHLLDSLFKKIKSEFKDKI